MPLYARLSALSASGNPHISISYLAARNTQLQTQFYMGFETQVFTFLWHAFYLLTVFQLKSLFIGC